MANTLKFGNGQWATKEGSTLAYNDENGNFKPLPFNFTRSTSATRVNKQGLIEVVSNNEPRIDFTNDSKGALLLEPSRSNLVTYSEDFSNASWIKANSTVTANSTISPKGDLSADTFELTGSAGRLQRNVTLSDNTDYTLSSFVKPISVTNNLLGVVAIRKDGSVSSAIFNISNGTIDTETNCNAKIESYTNGWYRLSITFNSLSGGTSPSIRPISNSTGSGGFTTGDSAYIWGAQLEQGSYATSYIPTQGSVATRDAEVCSQTPPSGIIGQTEGSIFIELDVNSRVLSSSWAFSLNDGTTSNYIGLRRSGGAEFFVHINVSGTTTALIATGITSGKNKISIGYAPNDIIVYVNGVNVGTDTSSSIPTTSDLQIGNLISNRTLEDSVSGFKLYNTRLSNSELAALTT